MFRFRSIGPCWAFLSYFSPSRHKKIRELFILTVFTITPSHSTAEKGQTFFFIQSLHRLGKEQEWSKKVKNVENRISQKAKQLLSSDGVGYFSELSKVFVSTFLPSFLTLLCINAHKCLGGPFSSFKVRQFSGNSNNKPLFMKIALNVLKFLNY